MIKTKKGFTLVELIILIFIFSFFVMICQKKGINNELVSKACNQIGQEIIENVVKPEKYKEEMYGKFISSKYSKFFGNCTVKFEKDEFSYSINDLLEKICHPKMQKIVNEKNYSGLELYDYHFEIKDGNKCFYSIAGDNYTLNVSDFIK